jgi:hypothetical protein
MTQKICSHCKKEFKSSPKRRIYCSDQCYREYYNISGRLKICLHCKKEFKSSPKRRIYCSDQCYREYYNISGRLKICPHCKKEFKSSKKRRSFCSEKCATESRKNYRIAYFKREDIKLKQKFNTNKYLKKRYKEDPEYKEKKSKKLENFLAQKASPKLIDKNIKKWLLHTEHVEILNNDPELKKKIDAKDLTNLELRRVLRRGLFNKQSNKKYFSTDKGKKKRVENMTSYYKANPHARFILAVRKRISGFMQIKKMTKRNKTFQMLGCTPQELILHIEKQFKPGMNWNNWSVHGWHLDHIVPLDSGKNQEEVEKLCHYTNLQPLWAEENLKKSNK